MFLSTRRPTQNTEVNSLRRDVERLKELRAEQELKTKWHQNKLKSELEAHKVRQSSTRTRYVSARGTQGTSELEVHKVQLHRASNKYFQCVDCLKYRHRNYQLHVCVFVVFYTGNQGQAR